MLLLALALTTTTFRCTFADPSAPDATKVFDFKRVPGALLDQNHIRYGLVGETDSGLAAMLWLAGKDLVTEATYVGYRAIVIDKITGAAKLTSVTVPQGGAGEHRDGTCTRL